MGEKRESSGFLIKQRAFLKAFLITNISNGRWYGKALLDELRKEFEPYGFEPQHSEVYRALHELMEDGILKRGKVKKEGTKYQEVAVYYILDQDKANAYKKLVKADLDRCKGLINFAIKENYS